MYGMLLPPFKFQGQIDRRGRSGGRRFQKRSLGSVMLQKLFDVATQGIICAALRRDILLTLVSVRHLHGIQEDRLGRARFGIHAATPAGLRPFDMQCDECRNGPADNVS